MARATVRASCWIASSKANISVTRKRDKPTTARRKGETLASNRRSSISLAERPTINRSGRSKIAVNSQRSSTMTSSATTKGKTSMTIRWMNAG